VICILFQDHPCFLGRGAEDCEEGLENTENQGQDGLKVETFRIRTEMLLCKQGNIFVDGDHQWFLVPSS
jgi:hypothetical protein